MGDRTDIRGRKSLWWDWEDSKEFPLCCRIWFVLVWKWAINHLPMTKRVGMGSYFVKRAPFVQWYWEHIPTVEPIRIPCPFCILKHRKRSFGA